MWAVALDHPMWQLCDPCWLDLYRSVGEDSLKMRAGYEDFMGFGNWVKEQREAGNV